MLPLSNGAVNFEGTGDDHLGRVEAANFGVVLVRDAKTTVALSDSCPCIAELCHCGANTEGDDFEQRVAGTGSRCRALHA